MNKSSTQLKLIDYGAGSVNNRRTEQEMRTGTEVIDSLGHLSTMASSLPLWCLILFKIIRTFSPKSCIEMGTSVGISTAYQGSALDLNKVGKLISIEGDPTLAEIARKNLKKIGLKNTEVLTGRFQETLIDVLERQKPLDYIFIDGHHDEKATLDYFELIIPFLASTAILIFDDIAWSKGMQRAWQKISSDERINLSLNLGLMGLCVLDNTISEKRDFSVPLH